MREISEYKLLGNYLINLYEKCGKDTIKYESLKSVTASVEKMLSSNFSNYTITAIEKKSELVKQMIYKGVFKTYPGNKTMPFKQIYPYEVSKYIFAEYNCDGSLCFKLAREIGLNKDATLLSMKKMYTSDSNLALQLAINKEINSLSTTKAKTRI